MKHKIKLVLRTTLIVIVAVIIGVNVYTLNAARLTGDKIPMPFGVGAAIVLSGSMEPELSVGDLLIIGARDSYEVGDVIVYQDNGIAITHRIVYIDDEQIITRGDANNVDDEPIYHKQVKGEVLYSAAVLGHIVDAIRSPIGTICVLGVAFLLLEGSFYVEKKKDKEELKNIQKEIEKLKQEQNENH